MNLRSIMLNEKSPCPQSFITYCMIPFMDYSLNDRDGKEMCGIWETGVVEGKG